MFQLFNGSRSIKQLTRDPLNPLNELPLPIIHMSHVDNGKFI